ncbi:hypothetical protein ACK3TF_000778 [Chlorella vulgaris]
MASLQAQYRPPKRLVNAPIDSRSLWHMPQGWQQQSNATTLVVQKYHQQHVLRYDWQATYFTDGSVQSTDAGTLVGAAVWRARDGACMIKNGIGPNNTITRAELAAIECAVSQMPAYEDCTVFTDSQVSIHLLRRALREPHTLYNHLHKDLLLRTVAHLVRRANAGTRTSILKVPAHTGVIGNEMADEAAKRAACLDAQHDHYTTPDRPFSGQWQPAFFDAPKDGAAANGPAVPCTVSNLNSALQKAVHASTKTGNSSKGIYATASEEMYNGLGGDRALQQESNAMWCSKKIGTSVLRTVMKHRMGHFWNKKLAFRRRVPYLLGRAGQAVATNDKCPLCNEPDSGGHILLHCRQRQMQAMYIKRHDGAVRMINQALQRHTKHGNAFTVLDACPAAELTSHRADAKRLPRWILPADEISDETLAKMRPDILRILELPSAPTEADIQYVASHKSQYTVQVVEIGYCSDTRWTARVADKLEQHHQLMAALRQAGWNVDERPHVIVLGACGATYLSGQQALAQLGLNKKQSSDLLTKLHLNAAGAAHDISLARRRLERTGSRTGVG